MITDIVVDDNALRCTLHCDVGVANAIRRVVMNEIPTFAPDEVTFDVNTSCMPDEYVAHRIGMVPFKGATTALTFENASIDVSGRTVMCSDMDSSVLEHDFAIIKMIDEQRLKCQIAFRKSTGLEHARFSVVAAAATKMVTCDRHVLSFEVINGDDPVEILQRGLSILEAKIASTASAANVSI